MTTTKTSYPFTSKKQIVARIAVDAAFAVECLQIMNDRQTAFEQATLTTKDRNRQGWMSSHAVNGGKLAVKAATDEGLTDEEHEKAVGIVSRYGRQLAEHFRGLKIAESPELAETAAIFGV